MSGNPIIEVQGLSIAGGTSGKLLSGNWTSFVAYQIATSVLATVGANQSGPGISFLGEYWNGSLSTVDVWQIQNVLGAGTNPTSTLTISHISGTPGTLLINLQAPVQVQGIPVAVEVCAVTISLSTGAINSGTRATNTASCSGLSTITDSISCTFSGDTNAVTGYAPSASGSLSIKTWISTGVINVDQINNTGSTITPGAATLNCKGLR